MSTSDILSENGISFHVRFQGLKCHKMLMTCFVLLLFIDNIQFYYIYFVHVYEFSSMLPFL